MKKKILIPALFIIIIFPMIYFLFPGVLLKLSIKYEMDSAGVSQKETEVIGQRIVYYEGGKGEGMLLVHGFGGDKSNFLRMAKYFTDKYRVVIVDLPGFGESSKHEKLKYNIKNQVQRLDEFVKRIGLDRFHIAGNSMGGAISVYYTYKHQNRILSLGLFDSAGIKCPVESHHRKELREGRNHLLAKSPDDFDRMMKYVFVKPPFVPKPILEHLASRAAESRAFNVKVAQDLESDYEYQNIVKYLPMIYVPALIVWGDKDRLIDVSCVEIFEEGIKNSKTHILKDCGHLPMTERPDESAGYYRDFLNSL